MFKKLSVVVILVSSVCLGGCASIVNGTNQSVSVQTPNAEGANCTLENNKGTWYVNNTPGSVVVHRSFQDMTIECKKKGYHPVVKRVGSSTKPMAFGNVVFGGVIGAGVDVADGAAYDYPTNIVVSMDKKAKA